MYVNVFMYCRLAINKGLVNKKGSVPEAIVKGGSN